jgi:hypothetical protein
MHRASVLTKKDTNYTIPPRLVMKGGANHDKKGPKGPATMTPANQDTTGTKANKENGAVRNKEHKQAKAEKMRKLLEALKGPFPT